MSKTYSQYAKELISQFSGQELDDKLSELYERQGATNSGFASGGILTEFNGGFTHDDPSYMNKLSGIPQGVGQDGKPNVVEKGETKFKNYIYSDRLKMNDSKSYNLGGGLDGKTFAYASKKLTKLSDERPNDPITKLGVDKSLERLKQANDDAIEMRKFSDENINLSGSINSKSKFEYGGYIFKDI